MDHTLHFTLLLWSEEELQYSVANWDVCILLLLLYFLSFRLFLVGSSWRSLLFLLICNLVFGLRRFFFFFDFDDWDFFDLLDLYFFV